MKLCRPKSFAKHTKPNVKNQALKEDKIFDGRLSCVGITGAELDGYAQYWFLKTGSKNPYNTSATYPSESGAPWVRGWKDSDVGFVYHNTVSQRKILYIQTCIKTPCTDNKNILSDTITPEQFFSLPLQ